MARAAAAAAAGGDQRSTYSLRDIITYHRITVHRLSGQSCISKNLYWTWTPNVARNHAIAEAFVVFLLVRTAPAVNFVLTEFVPTRFPDHPL